MEAGLPAIGRYAYPSKQETRKHTPGQSETGYQLDKKLGVGNPAKLGRVQKIKFRCKPGRRDGFLERRFGDEEAACDYADEADGLFTKISGCHEEVKIRTIQVKNTPSNRLCSPLVQRIVDTACPRSFCPPWLIGV